MTMALSRAVMSLAACCLGEDRREWACAMQAEFEMAEADGKPLSFAFGCLITACRELPNCAEGRFAFANYALALGVLVPVAGIQLTRILGFFPLFAGGPHGILAQGAGWNPFLVWSQLSAVPILFMLWVFLGAGNLCLAWALVERDWSRVFRIGAMLGAQTITLLLLMEMLLLDVTFLMSQTAALAIEFAAIFVVAKWHGQLSQPPAEQDALRPAPLF
jgi:hypothetical protein